MSVRDRLGPDWVRRIASILMAATVFFFVGVVIWQNWQEIRDAELDLRPGLLAASALLLGAYFFGRSLLWLHLTRQTGVAIPFGDSVAAWFYSQLGKYLPGKVFLYLGRLYYYRRLDRSVAVVSMTFLVETLATLSAAVVTVLVALLTLDVGDVDAWRPVLLAALVGLAIMLNPRFLNGALAVVLRLLRRSPQRVDLTAAQSYNFVLLYVANWLIFGVAFAVFINSIVSISFGYVVYLAGSFALASLAGMFSLFVPSGLGVREGILMFMLSQVMPLETAIVISVAARLWFTAVELGGIGIVRIVTKAPIAWSARADTGEDDFSGLPSESKGNV